MYEKTSRQIISNTNSIAPMSSMVTMTTIVAL